MTRYKVYSPGGEGVLVVGTSPLGKGGEGAVYAVESHDADFLPAASELVVKTYYEPEANDRKEKVIAMVKAKPNSDSVAWPLAVVSDGSFKGYVMPKLDTKTQKEWLYLANTKERRDYAPSFNVQYALNTCLNLAFAIKSVHVAGHLLGDINESNAFVGVDSSVTIVDTDSAQITSPDGTVFVCGVGKQEFLAPELIGHNLREVKRTEASDVFAFAVMVFQMMTGGAHPTDGKYVGNGDVPSTASRISQGIYPTLRNERANGFEPAARIPSSALPLKLQSALLRCFEVDASARITLDEFIEVLQDVMDNFIQCSVEKRHYYDSRDGDCGWCSHAFTQADPWGDKKELPKINQKTLPALSFNEGSGTPTTPPPRAPINGPTKSNRRRTARSGAPSLSSLGSGSASVTPTLPPINNSSISSTQLISSNKTVKGAMNYPIPANPNTIPEKVEGKTTIIYPDGTYGVRPALRDLARSNKKLFIRSIMTETPDFMKFWWSKNRMLPDFGGLIIGAFVSILIIVIAHTFVSNPYFTGFIANLAEFSVIAASVITALFFINSLVFALKRKSYAIKRENVFKTAGRFALVSLSYLFIIPWWTVCVVYYLFESREK